MDGRPPLFDHPLIFFFSMFSDAAATFPIVTFPVGPTLHTKIPLVRRVLRYHRIGFPHCTPACRRGGISPPPLCWPPNNFQKRRVFFAAVSCPSFHARVELFLTWRTGPARSSSKSLTIPREVMTLFTAAVSFLQWRPLRPVRGAKRPILFPPFLGSLDYPSLRFVYEHPGRFLYLFFEL